MSTDTQQLVFDPPLSGIIDLSGAFDRILHTASDRPFIDTLPALADPTADHTENELARRRADVEEKHRRIRDFLDSTSQDAVILGRADSIAWFTAGGDLGMDLGSEMSPVVLFITRTSRAVVTDNVQSARVFEEELAGLGFQLKERAWYDSPGRVIDELSHNKRVACDLGPRVSPWAREGDALQALRRPLTSLERQRLRELGRTLTLAVEATCRNFDRGENEADVAGHLAHRLIREGVVPVDLKIAGDDRLARFRQPAFKSAPIMCRATITATGRRFGLCATLSRTVSFEPVNHEYRCCHAVRNDGRCHMYLFSRPGEPVQEVIRRARRIYEKFDHTHEWTLDYLGFMIGYSPREALLVPDSRLTFGAGSAVCWSPSIGSARSADTIAIDDRGYECVTAPQNWPSLDVAVKGYIIQRPGVLER